MSQTKDLTISAIVIGAGILTIVIVLSLNAMAKQGTIGTIDAIIADIIIVAIFFILAYFAKKQIVKGETTNV